MNYEKIKSTAEKSFGDITEIKKDLYSGYVNIKNKRAGKYYLDFNTQITCETFQEYQENLLSTEFYELEENLPWNLYLFFIRSAVDPIFKRRVEADEKYARKYVFTENQFIDYFTLEKSTDEHGTNIISKLILKLDAAKLSDIYGGESLAGTVSNFLKNSKSPKSRISRLPPNSSEPRKIESISFLRLNPTYREFPKEVRSFHFGTVNLIEGINGVGKTSILEALELMVCGRTLRNYDIVENDSCIEAAFNMTQKIISFESNNNKLYQSRDEYWYSNNVSRKNDMPYSFNKYNFFNADAAYSFTNSSDENSIKRALNDIIFGAEYNYIKTRIKKLFPDFRREHNKLLNQISEAQNNIIVSENVIKNKKQESNYSSLEEAILGSLNLMKFKRNNFKIDSDYGKIETLNNEVLSYIQDIINHLGQNENKTFKQIQSEYSKNQKEIKLILETNIRIDKILLNLTETNISIKNALEQVAYLKSCNVFFDNPLLFRLENLSERLRSNENLIKKDEYIEKTLSEIDLNQFRNETSIYNFDLETKTSIENLEIQLLKIDSKIKSSLKEFTQIEKIIQEIKFLGKTYLAENKNVEECPLCNTAFQYEELRERMENLTLPSQVPLEELQKQQNELSTLVSFKTNILNDLSKFSSLAHVFSGDIKQSDSISELLEKIEEFRANRNQRTDERNMLENVIKLSTSFGITETDFNNLKSNLTTFIDKLFLYENKEYFQEQLAVLTEAIDKLETEKGLKEENIKREFDELKNKMDFQGLNFENISTILFSYRQQETRLTSILISYDKLVEILDIPEDCYFQEIGIAANILARNIVSYKQELQTQVEFSIAEKNKAEAFSFIEKNKELHKKLNKAYETLESIDANENIDLEEFFKSNLKEVIDIFKSIHSPQEFVDIFFQNGHFTLVTTEGEKRQLTQVSTGQRSALAISLFLALNRKLKNGPNIIIFDDPVSFVDDLNILSFLDFLRFFILKENKQIFLATANSKLASLFKKKFDFLNEDFKQWHLKRYADVDN